VSIMNEVEGAREENAMAGGEGSLERAKWE
jgi:hypothetical protein